MGIPDGMQEAILRLSGVVTFEQLEETLRDALELALPNVTDAIVYLWTPESQELYSSQGLVHTLPKEGLPWDAVQQRQRLIVDGLDSADPMSGLLKSGNAPLPSSRKGLLCCGVGWGTSRKQRVVCSPVVDKENDRVLGVFLVVCDQLSVEDNHHLSFLEKQLLVCYRRLKQSSTPFSNHAPSPASQADSRDHAILKLCADLYEQDAASLQLKVISYLKERTQAQSGFLLLVDLDHRELFCQVIGDRVLNEEIRFPIDQNSFSSVIKTKQPVTLENIQDGSWQKRFLKDHREELEESLGYKVHSFLTAPVCNKVTGKVVAVCCLVNKTTAERFTDEDMEAIDHCFKYTTTVLHSTLAVQSERKLKNQTQALLQVARNLFTHLDDLTKLLREIMQEARNLTKAERCSVFLLETETNELVAKVFDGDVREQKLQTPQKEVRIPADSGIAGYVNTTGELLNIDDAYSHPLFYRGVDESTGFRTRNILCFPIKDENGEIIGVAQLCNKVNGVGFSSFDEDIAQAFSVYCCISIVHSLLYKRVREAQSRNQLANELMIYHMQVGNDEVEQFCKQKTIRFSDTVENFYEFSFLPRSISYDDTAAAVLWMFEDMGFISKFKINKEHLSRFVLMARRGYRDPPYHNWAHAFAVAHFCYLMYKNLDLVNYIDDIEAFALFVACICHDIDHRGTTNSFQVQSESSLAALYSSEGSVLERHHFAQTMCILNTDNCNIFANLGKNDYEMALDLIRDIILATDLAHHLRIVKELEKMAEAGYNRADKKQKVMLLCLLMTSCDLSDQTKHWQNSKNIAELIYQEFFRQGDLEKSKGQNPLDMMDRDKAHIPELQVGFLNGIALPVFRILAKIFPKAEPVLAAVENNKRMWLCLNQLLHEKNLPYNMDMFQLDIAEEMDDAQGIVMPIVKSLPSKK